MSARGDSTLVRALRSQGGVLLALMLRDVRTRMFGSAFGYLAAIAWPLSHIMILVGIYASIGRMPPYGHSMALWCASGVVPFMSFSYMSRFLMMSVVTNKPLLYFPRISVNDVVIARAVLETLSATTVVVAVVVIFLSLGFPIAPASMKDAMLAFLASLLLGLGAGVLNAVISATAPAWVTGYSLIIVLLWMTSGVLFVPSQMPQIAQTMLSYNPVVHLLEWMRDAYYADYRSPILDKAYVLWWGLGMLSCGLLYERLFRGKTKMV